MVGPEGQPAGINFNDMRRQTRTVNTYQNTGAAPKVANENQASREVQAWEKVAYLDLLSRDLSLHPASLKVAIYLSFRFNAARGCAWPLPTTMARELGMTLRSVRRSLQQLISKSYVVAVWDADWNREVWTPQFREARSRPSAPSAPRKRAPGMKATIDEF
jgi:hypothetical protein